MKNFIFVAAVVTIFGIVTCDDHSHAADIKKSEEECVKETGVEFAKVTKAENGEFQDGDDLKGFPKCFFLKNKFMLENGEYDEAAVMAYGESLDNKETRLPVIKECLKKTGKDIDDKAYHGYRCYYEGLKKHNLKP